MLLQFVRHCADNFLCSEQRAVRLEAVRTCSQLLKCALQESVKLKKKPLRSSGVRLVSATVAEVLSKLLTAVKARPRAHAANKQRPRRDVVFVYFPAAL